MDNDRLLELDNGTIIDLSKVECVSPLKGNPSTRNGRFYVVYLTSGKEVKIYDSGVHSSEMKTMDRDEFVKRLKQV